MVPVVLVLHKVQDPCFKLISLTIFFPLVCMCLLDFSNMYLSIMTLYKKQCVIRSSLGFFCCWILTVKIYKQHQVQHCQRFYSICITTSTMVWKGLLHIWWKAFYLYSYFFHICRWLYCYDHQCPDTLRSHVCAA